MHPNTKTAGWLSVFVCLLVAAVSTGQAGSDSKEKLHKAIEYFKGAQYDNAISLLAELSTDKTLDKESLREVQLGLGRVYLAKNLSDKARASLENLLKLEPPAVSLDPDLESPPLMRIYYDVRKEKSGSLQVERTDPGIKTIAILDFSNRSIDEKERYDPMEKGFAELMISQLNGSVNLKVVERERINWLLGEINLENDPTKFDPETAVRVGKLLGVHSVLFGSFIKTRNDLWIGTRLVKVETGEILSTDQIKGDPADFFELAENLSAKVAKGINVTISEADIQKGTATKSLDAMMSYSEGLIFLEKGDYKEAYDKFQQALGQDPSYEKARKKAESVKPLLG